MAVKKAAVPSLIGPGLLAVLLFAYATTNYLGYHYYSKSARARAQVKNIDAGFKKMEKDLRGAVSIGHSPEFYGALGRLYLDKALSENAAGKVEERDSYLDLAVAGYAGLIKRNPIDALAYYDLGRAYLLYNFPLQTYAEKARRYFRKAIELDPSDEFLNVNVLYIYLTQWASLDAAEREFVTNRLEDILRYNANFIPQIRDMWKRNFGDTDKLEETLSTRGLWPQLQQYF